jgi:hypothetical protein
LKTGQQYTGDKPDQNSAVDNSGENHS